MNFVLGARGRLGRAISDSLPPDTLITPERIIYSEWWREDGPDHVSRYLESQTVDPGVVYVALGIIDPRNPQEEHFRVNYLLTRNIIEGAARLGFKVISFGTVMENLAGTTSNNPYFLSKKKLGSFVEDFVSKTGLALHVRIHTLFGGGEPNEFMFLGQMLHALTSRETFKMSSGTQLREYHHLDDEVLAISSLVEAEISGTINLSHGDPVTLRDMAIYVFTAFDCLDLLKVGALPGPKDDNFNMVFKRTPILGDISFRATLPAVVGHLKKYISKQS